MKCNILLIIKPIRTPYITYVKNLEESPLMNIIGKNRKDSRGILERIKECKITDSTIADNVTGSLYLYFSLITILFCITAPHSGHIESRSVSSQPHALQNNIICL